MSNLSHTFRKTAERFPKKTCVKLRDKTLSFSEVEGQASTIATFLTKQGLNHGDRVGLFMKKSLEEVCIIIAAFKAGFVLVHINPTYKSEQLHHVAQDSGLKVLFTDSTHMPAVDSVLPSIQIKLVISRDENIGTDHSHVHVDYSDIFRNSTNTFSYQDESCIEDDIASIIYTSGSTGKPKGIIVTHRILDDSTRASIEVFKNTEQDRLISISPFSFDGSLSQLLTVMYVGGTLILQQSLFPKDVVTTMLKEKITGFHAVPTFWRILLGERSPFAKHEYPDLRYISIVGEPITENDIRQLFYTIDKTLIYVIYGTTEAFRSTFKILSCNSGDFQSAGHPFPGVEIHILDEEGEPCALMQVGEIVHSGNFISPGYWNNKSSTDKVFRDGRLFTGDLGMKDNTGQLHFIGRKDGLLKLQGFRVNPSEIESCVVELNGVQAAAVCPFMDTNSNQNIALYLATSTPQHLSTAEVIAHCKSRLPYYMIPNRIIFRYMLPKTGNGKIDKHLLSQELYKETEYETV